MQPTILLGDTHFGVSNSSLTHHAYMKKFFKDFFDYIDDNGVTKIIQLGDLFDVRKHINTWSSKFFREVFLKEVLKRNLHVYVLLGNHDIFYRESLEVSSVEEMLHMYPESFTIIRTPTDIEVNGNSFLAVPWVCKENNIEVQKAIKDSKSDYCVGHFEFNGFELFKGQLAKTHFDHTEYKKFKKVFSGHYHHMSSKDNVLYTGTPYELTWQDCNTTKGFFVIKGDDIELVENEHTLYSSFKLSDYDEIPESVVREKYVKILIDVPLEPKKREALLDRLYSMKPHDIKIIEKRVEVEASKTTFSQSTSISDLITDYVSNVSLGVDIDKDKLSSIMMTLYVEASADAS